MCADPQLGWGGLRVWRGFRLEWERSRAARLTSLIADAVELGGHMRYAVLADKEIS